ncbi:pseudouridylate synthase, partial [Thalassiosira pseudonana CCMP1335]
VVVSNKNVTFQPIRINKVFKKTHSRRQADQLVADGRITINDEPVHSAGQRVSNGGANSESSTQVFEYIKYWKPLGVTCTTDRRIYDNLIDALQQDGCRPKSRIFPVGRLDKETSGIILMTSDGRLPNAALRGKYKHPKTYVVKANRPVANDDIKRLREGVPLTAPTLPCKVKAVQLSTLDLSSRYLEITLVEGRNRQIRKMLEAIGYRVMELHRKSFMNLTLENLEGEGDWAHLTNREMEIVREVLDRAEQED